MNNRNGHIDYWKSVFDIYPPVAIYFEYLMQWFKKTKRAPNIRSMWCSCFRKVLYFAYLPFMCCSECMNELIVFSHMRVLFTGVCVDHMCTVYY